MVSFARGDSYSTKNPPRRIFCHYIIALLPTSALPETGSNRPYGRTGARVAAFRETGIKTFTAPFPAIIRAMVRAVVMPYNFALPYYVARVIGVLMDYVIFIDGIVLVTYYMLMPDYALGTGAAKFPAYHRFGTATGASICATTIHGINSFL